MGPANVGGSISHIPLRNLVSHEREQEICISFLSSFSIFCSQSGLYLLLALLRSFPIKCKSRINCKMPHASFLARISIPICEIIQFLDITTLTSDQIIAVEVVATCLMSFDILRILKCDLWDVQPAYKMWKKSKGGAECFLNTKLIQQILT